MRATEWNKKYPVGTPVRYWSMLREGEGTVSRTRSEAWNASGSDMVLVEGRSGGIALTHVDPIEEPPAHLLTRLRTIIGGGGSFGLTVSQQRILAQAVDDEARLLASKEKTLRFNLELFRDSVQNQRHQLADNGMDSGQVNDVLSVFDDFLGDYLVEGGS